MPQTSSVSKPEAILSALMVLVLAGLLLGPSMTYLFHSLAFLVACRLLRFEEDWRKRTVAYFSDCRWIWSLLFVFCVIFSLPFIFGEQSKAKDFGELKWVLSLLGLLMPLAALLRSKGSGTHLVWSFRLLFVVVSLSTLNALVEFATTENILRNLLGQNSDDFGRRANGLVRNPIPFGHAMGGFFWIGAAGALTAWISGSKRVVRIASLVAACGFLCVLMSQTRGAWLAIAIVSVLSLAALRGKSLKLWWKGLAVACLVGLVAVGLSGETRERLRSGFDPSERSNSLRIELWQANFEILKANPWGIGYNANDQLIDKAFDELGFSKHQWMGHSHNEFVEIGVGSGWLGLLLYVVLTGWLFLRTLKAFRGTSPELEPWVSFILLSSILVQLFINACALTDQMSTPGRYLLCMAWAIAIVVPVERSTQSSYAGR